MKQLVHEVSYTIYQIPFWFFKPVVKFCTGGKYYDQQKQPPEVFNKKGVLKILKNSQENTCVRVSFFHEVLGLRPAIFPFPVNFANFLRNPFLLNTSKRLLLGQYCKSPDILQIIVKRLRLSN